MDDEPYCLSNMSRLRGRAAYSKQGWNHHRQNRAKNKHDKVNGVEQWLKAQPKTYYSNRSNRFVAVGQNSQKKAGRLCR